jgi:spore coat polysaccharide biosynthesis protein SpsF
MIAVLVQARIGSSRLPGKVMMPVEGQPLIVRVLERAQRARTPNLVALVTGARQRNSAMCDFVESRGISVFCGSDDDVLERYFLAACHFKADTVVRVTGDCPLGDPDVLDDVVAFYDKTGADYTSNVHEPTFPDGLDVEVMSFAALERAHRAAKLSSEREHVTPYIWKNSELFKQANWKSSEDLSAMRWCVDDERDLEFVRSIYRELLPIKRDFGMHDILALLKRQPGLVINSDTQRNEGYLLSLINERGKK